jgi:hypothetical protein
MKGKTRSTFRGLDDARSESTQNRKGKIKTGRPRRGSKAQAQVRTLEDSD